METVYIEKTDIGSTLTTYIYCNMWQLWTAEKMGLTGYINWPRDRRKWLVPYWDDAQFDRVPNAFEWYFKQPEPSFQGNPPAANRVWEWEHCPELGVHPFMSQPLSVIKDYYRKNLHFSDAVEARGQALVAKYGIDFAKTIGVTWRGTDCVLDGRPRLSIEVYFQFLDVILEKDPGLRIMTTAEELGVLDPLLKRYPNAFLVEEFFSAPHGGKDNPERHVSLSGYERGMQPALMVWLFSKCAHYVKNRSSTGGVASWLSTGRIVSIAHSEVLGYGDDITKAEIEGKFYPLYS